MPKPANRFCNNCVALSNTLDMVSTKNKTLQYELEQRDLKIRQLEETIRNLDSNLEDGEHPPEDWM